MQAPATTKIFDWHLSFRPTGARQSAAQPQPYAVGLGRQLSVHVSEVTCITMLFYVWPKDVVLPRAHVSRGEVARKAYDTA